MNWTIPTTAPNVFISFPLLFSNQKEKNKGCLLYHRGRKRFYVYQPDWFLMTGRMVFYITFFFLGAVSEGHDDGYRIKNERIESSNKTNPIISTQSLIPSNLSEGCWKDWISVRFSFHIKCFQGRFTELTVQ